MHNDVLLILKTLLLFINHKRVHRGIKMGQRKLMCKGMKINYKTHFNRQPVDLVYLLICLHCNYVQTIPAALKVCSIQSWYFSCEVVLSSCVAQRSQSWELVNSISLPVVWWSTMALAKSTIFYVSQLWMRVSTVAGVQPDTFNLFVINKSVRRNTIACLLHSQDTNSYRFPCWLYDICVATQASFSFFPDNLSLHKGICLCNIHIPC